MENLGPPLIRIFVGTSFSIFEVSRRKKRIFFSKILIYSMSRRCYMLWHFSVTLVDKWFMIFLKSFFYQKLAVFWGFLYVNIFFFWKLLELSSIVLMSANYEKKEIYVYNYLMIVHHHNTHSDCFWAHRLTHQLWN